MDNKTSITYFDHAMFLIESINNIKIGLDPYDEQVKENLPDVSADIVLESHDHFDHSNTSLFNGNPEVLKKPVKKTIKSIEIAGLPTFHDKANGKERGKNIIFKFKVDNITFAHLGDLGHLLDKEQYADLADVNIMMIPVGGIYTVNYKEAMEIINKVKPNIAIPMHYKKEDTKIGVDTLDKFLDFVGDYKEKDQKVELTKNSLPEETEIWALNTD